MYNVLKKIFEFYKLDNKNNKYKISICIFKFNLNYLLTIYNWYGRIPDVLESRIQEKLKHHIVFEWEVIVPLKSGLGFGKIVYTLM